MAIQHLPPQTAATSAGRRKRKKMLAQSQVGIELDERSVDKRDLLKRKKG